MRGGDEQEMPTSAIVVGDLIRLRPGDKVAVDGEIVEGGDEHRRSAGYGRERAGRQGAGRSRIGGSINHRAP